jgi:hypothetical protein
MPPQFPPSARPILVVQRRWPQQENPALPLLPADAPAVLAGRVTSVAAPLPVDAASLVGRLDPRDLDLPETAVLRGVVEHAVRAAGDVAGTLTLVAADVGATVLVYALLVPDPTPSAIPVAESAQQS